jgi:tight adherence protein B
MAAPVIVAAILLTAAALVLFHRGEVPTIPWHALAAAGAAGLTAGVVAAVVVGTPVMVIVASVVGAAIPGMRRRSSRERRRLLIRSQWPDAIDVVRSAIRSGATVAEAVAGAAPRVPEVLQPRFREVAAHLSVGDSFARSVTPLAQPDDDVARRFVACLTLADEMGSADTGRVLSALVTFVRSDVAQQREVSARHSWNVAAARIALIAPWLTVAALSVQPTARATYASGGGSVLLAVVAVVTLAAYAAMNRIVRPVREGEAGT